MRLWLALCMIGMPGVIAVAVWIVPALVALSNKPTPVPMSLLQLVSGGQSAAFMALAVWAGVALAARVELRAPILEAMVFRREFPAVSASVLMAGAVGGVAAGLYLVGLDRLVPAALARLRGTLSPPLPVRLLYGGITEELLMRWGLMSALLWLAWVSLQRRDGAPRLLYVWSAIVSSAILFGVGHLPAAAALAGGLSRSIVTYVVAGNALFGLLAGFLFWRYGLEAAILAHGLAHVVAYTAERI